MLTTTNEKISFIDKKIKFSFIKKADRYKSY